MIRRNDVLFLGGDFNMALFVVPGQMWSRSLETRWCGSYAWRKAGSATSRSPAVAGPLHLDSMGFFAIGPAPRVEPWISMQALSDEHSEKHLETFPNGQGYEASSYCGGMKSIKECLTGRWSTPPQTSADLHGDGPDPPHPHIKQKRIRKDLWDIGNQLFAAGAHMPLLFFIGEQGRRSAQALDRRGLVIAQLDLFRRREVEHTRRRRVFA